MDRTYLYVQALIGGEPGDELVSFRHTVVAVNESMLSEDMGELAWEAKAYDLGQRTFYGVESNAGLFSNDYVIRVDVLDKGYTPAPEVTR